MQILLTNDDGIHAPGLRALRDALAEVGDVQVVAPAAEQSGVGHTITYLHPLMVHEEFRNGQHFGWAVAGSPADCVKLGILEFCKQRPELVVSGINAGANVGINVLYSGTVAAAVEGAFFGITSIAVSLAEESPAGYQATARRAVAIIEELRQRSHAPGALWNVNFPGADAEDLKGVKLVSLGLQRHTDVMERRKDPRGRMYYWSGLDPLENHHMEPGTDVKELADGFITVTPMHFDLTHRSALEDLRNNDWQLPPDSGR